MKIGSLFSGYGGLDRSVEYVFPGAAPAWFCEWDDAPARILAHHWPGVPNLRDVTAVDWSQVEPVDILTGGYPCQPFSAAGLRKGTEDDRHLWPYVADAMATLRPQLALFENVRGHLTLGFDQVLRDLKQLNYRARWVTIRAADVGAAHGRARLFILAEDNRSERPLCGGADRRGGVYRNPAVGRDVPAPTEGKHVRQGDALAACVESAVWREDLRRPGCDELAACLVHVGADRGQGWGSDRAPVAPVSSEASGSGCGIGVQAASSVVGAFAPTWPAVDSGGSGSGVDAAVSHTGSESARPGPRPASTADGNGADGDLPLGMVVGAERQFVRPGGVRGEATDERDDDCGACLRIASANSLTLLPAPQARDWKDHQVQVAGHWPDDKDSINRAIAHLLPTPRTSDTNGPGVHGAGGQDLRTVIDLLPTPRVRDHIREGYEAGLRRSSPQLETTAVAGVKGDINWGDYADAIARWERVLGRPAPAPTEPGTKGNPRLSPRFVEWLMGLPSGHVTDPAIGLTRNQQLKALGNGVVPQQGAAALRHLLDIRNSDLTTSWKVSA